MTQPVPCSFLWGAATSAHQTEGNNTNSDWWAFEHSSDAFVREPSGDAADSYHRWGQDMDLLAGAGFTDYRFSVEWARIEPAPGEFSDAQVAHYRRMVDGAVARGLRPLVTLHHFTNPIWFDVAGGWAAADAAERFLRYVDAVSPIIASDVEHVCTINEPNMVSLFPALREQSSTDLSNGIPEPDAAVASTLIEAHRAASSRIKSRTPDTRVGWSVACFNLQPEPGVGVVCDEYAYPRQTVFIEAARHDDWIGVQSYTRTKIGEEAGRPVRLPVPAGIERTLTGWEYYPAALGEAVREVARIVGTTVPIIVTENGIATSDDERRRYYTRSALESLAAAMRDGIDVRGYFHWSLLDNYEWGSYRPTFGLVAVDRETFVRAPKPSLAWLGSVGPTSENPIVEWKEEVLANDT